MLINLALSYVCSGIQALVAFILDERPSLQPQRVPIVIGLCVTFFLLGLSMCTNGGIHLFTIFDKRCTSSLLFLTFLEVILVSHFYGLQNFYTMLDEMEMRFPKYA